MKKPYICPECGHENDFGYITGVWINDGGEIFGSTKINRCEKCGVRILFELEAKISLKSQVLNDERTQIHENL